ncbi:hypothetical protein KSP39_PZI013786 [Platanthera zijinensis]|uniref:Uncharacterized protein n=1 Tax=Platanthera zijinensis TaxID=2320716 RepID=A0AAP0BCW1_9ASPA
MHLLEDSCISWCNKRAQMSVLEPAAMLPTLLFSGRAVLTPRSPTSIPPISTFLFNFYFPFYEK